jgi:hypothetical protein
MIDPNHGAPRPMSDSPLPAVADQAADTSELTAAQLAELGDESKQTEYRQQFLLQMQRRSCSGCGD